MKKSVEILGLPIISITEGCELGMSKTLLIDAKNGLVAAITIEDEDWYRGVKLIPYESVIAIGDDAVTVTNSENILKLDEAGDYENLLDENIRVIGTKAITKNGTIQGKISELFIGDNGKIEKCEITAPDGTTSEVTADQISIFGKQVTVIDAEKKTEFIIETPAPEPVQAEEEISATASNDVSDFGAVSVPEEVPATVEGIPAVEEVPAIAEEIPTVAEEVSVMPEIISESAEEVPAALESVMTPEPLFEQPEEVPQVEEVPAIAEEIPQVEEVPAIAEEIPAAVEEIPQVEEIPAVAEEIPQVEEIPAVAEEVPQAEEVPAVAEEIPTVAEEIPTVAEEVPTVAGEVPATVEEIPAVEEPAPIQKPVLTPEPAPQEEKTAETLTQQAEALKAALKRAMANQQKANAAKAEAPAQSATEKAVDDRRRRLLLGKKAARTIKADNGIVIVEEGADITEEVLQKAKLANKFMDLSMNYI